MGDHVIDSAPAWSNHAEAYHGKSNAPNLPKAREVWHASESGRVGCLICGKDFQAGKGFAKHLKTHKDAGIFKQPFQCIECPEGTLIDGEAKWIDHSVRTHGGCSRSGAGPKGAYDAHLTGDRSAKKAKTESLASQAQAPGPAMIDSVVKEFRANVANPPETNPIEFETSWMPSGTALESNGVRGGQGYEAPLGGQFGEIPIDPRLLKS
ncbi:hypothetical protein V8F06_014455 [Rhypophila decipiens]